MDLRNYLKQHGSIKEEMNVIRKLISASNITDYSREITLHVNTLAGKIKVHLSMEDKYLYPGMLDQGNEQVQKLATAFQEEMGGLADAFVSYKEKYNTPPKVMQNTRNIKSDTNKVFSEIEKRIQKEEAELYKLI